MERFLFELYVVRKNIICKMDGYNDLIRITKILEVQLIEHINPHSILQKETDD